MSCRCCVHAKDKLYPVNARPRKRASTERHAPGSTVAVSGDYQLRREAHSMSPSPLRQRGVVGATLSPECAQARIRSAGDVAQMLGHAKCKWSRERMSPLMSLHPSKEQRMCRLLVTVWRFRAPPGASAQITWGSMAGLRLASSCEGCCDKHFRLFHHQILAGTDCTCGTTRHDQIHRSCHRSASSPTVQPCGLHLRVSLRQQVRVDLMDLSSLKAPCGAAASPRGLHQLCTRPAVASQDRNGICKAAVKAAAARES